MSTVPPPAVIYIEPTNDCNLRCVMCPRSNVKKPVGYIDFDLYAGIVDQIAGTGMPVTVYLHLSGEPLMHPRISDMVAYAKGAGVRRVGFSTNATLLTGNLSRALVDAGLDFLTVSMDSSTGSRYCAADAAAVGGVDDAVLGLLEARRSAGRDRPTVRMRIIDMPSVSDLIETFRRKWEGVADEVQVQPFLTWGGQIRVPGRTIDDADLDRRTVCLNALAQVAVQHDGQVSFCCLYMDSAGDGSGIIGDLRRQSLADVLASDRRRAVVEAMFRHDWPAVSYCAACPDWQEYTGARDRSRGPTVAAP
jgi:hypothetical protein